MKRAHPYRTGRRGVGIVLILVALVTSSVSSVIVVLRIERPRLGWNCSRWPSKRASPHRPLLEHVWGLQRPQSERTLDMRRGESHCLTTAEISRCSFGTSHLLTFWGGLIRP